MNISPFSGYINSQIRVVYYSGTFYTILNEYATEMGILMRNQLRAIENHNNEAQNPNNTYDSSTIQLSISVVLVFFAWFFILPSSVCTYAYVLADAFRISGSLFIVLSNSAGLLGLLIGGALGVFYSHIKKLLLFLVSFINLYNILIFVVPPKVGFFLIISQYLMLGMYVSLTTYFFFINTLYLKRYVFAGSILASIVLITAFFRQGPSGVTATSVFIMNLLISFVVLVFIIFLNLLKAQPKKFIPVANAGKSILGTFLLLCVYTFVLSFSLGYLSNETELILTSSGVLSSVLNVLPYVGTMILIFSLPMRRFHTGVITYTANALLIISIAYMNFFNSQTALSGLINVILYFSIAVNQLFIFDTIMGLSEIAIRPAITISAGVFVFVLGSAVGDHAGEMIFFNKINTIDRPLITLIAIASMILPLLRILLSMHSKTSIFRINPVALANLPATESTDQSYGINPDPNIENTKIYPQIESYNLLTKREKEILDLLIKGYPSEVICSKLFISVNTLKRHVQNIYNKLNVHNRAELFKMLHKT